MSMTYKNIMIGLKSLDNKADFVLTIYFLKTNLLFL